MRAVFESSIRLIWDLFYFLTGEGSWSLRPHESVVLEAAIDSLPEPSRALFHSRLKGTMFVQRSHKQISWPRFYTAPYLSDRRTIKDDELSEYVVDVKFDVDGLSQVANVDFFKGRLDTIQFKRPASYYAGKTLRVTDVRPGKPHLTHGAALDRLEHGREH